MTFPPGLSSLRTLPPFGPLRERVTLDGLGVLFAGVVPRVLWNGIVVGAATPLKSVGFYLARDGVILELFDEVARSSASAASLTIG